MVSAVRAGQSVLVLGEAGSGKTTLARACLDALSSELSCALSSYKGSLKQVLADMAQQLGIPTENENDKKLTAEQLKQEIAINVNEQTVLFCDNANRWPASLRYWLEELLSTGVMLVLFAVHNPKKDVFLRLLEIELVQPSDLHIRVVMAAEAQRLGVKLSRAQLAKLQARAGRNPMLARKVIQQEALGFESTPEHSQYMDISPMVLAALALLGMVRFIGLGTGDRALYVVGGCAVVVVLALRYLGRMSKNRRRLGQ